MTTHTKLDHDRLSQARGTLADLADYNPSDPTVPAIYEVIGYINELLENDITG